MKVVLKGAWSVEVHEAALVGTVNEKGGDAQWGEGLTVFHVLTLFDNKIYVCP